MTLSPSVVIEALAWWEAADPEIVGRNPYRENLIAAARLWVEGEELAWCAAHGKPATGAALDSCDNYILVAEGFQHCRIVSARICVEGGSG